MVATEEIPRAAAEPTASIDQAQQHIELALRSLWDRWPWRRPRRIEETIGRLLDSSAALRIEAEEQGGKP